MRLPFHCGQTAMNGAPGSGGLSPFVVVADFEDDFFPGGFEFIQHGLKDGSGVVVEAGLFGEDGVGEAGQLFRGAGDGLFAVLDARERLRFESQILADLGGLLAQPLAEEAHLGAGQVGFREDQIARNDAHQLLQGRDFSDDSSVWGCEVLDSY